MRELNLLEKSHAKKTIRKIDRGWRTEENKIIAKKYDKEFFDGDRVNGYGGYYYDGRWRRVVEELIEVYGINSDSSVLDIGCAKGFLLYDLKTMIPGIKVAGIDISKYALSHAMEGYGKFLTNKLKETSLGLSCISQEANPLEKKAKESVLPHMIKGSADELPWMDSSFDVVLAINTIHNLPEERCRKSIKEMLRVGKKAKNMFIEVDAYRNEEERERMKNWVLTAEIVKSVDDWKRLYEEEGYDGDYFWFTA